MSITYKHVYHLYTLCHVQGRKIGMPSDTHFTILIKDKGPHNCKVITGIMKFRMLLHTYICTQTHTHMGAHTHTVTHSHTCAHMHTYTHVHTYVYTYTLAHSICIGIHTYTQRACYSQCAKYSGEETSASPFF